MAKTICDKALNTIMIGNPLNKKPNVVPKDTKVAILGEINIAINIGTWLAKVKDAGGITIFGKNIGIRIPKAHKSAAVTNSFAVSILFIHLLTLN